MDYTNIPHITINGSVATNDDDNSFPAVTLTSTDTDVCYVVAEDFRNLNGESPYYFETAVTIVSTGTCEITVTAEEDELSVAETLSITLPELAPSVAASARGNLANIAEDAIVTVRVTATKRDISYPEDATFPTDIASTSSPSCIATLDGNAVQLYDGAGVGSTAIAIYNIASGSRVGDCGDFSFTATENSLTGTAAPFNGISFMAGPDADNDAVSDRFDLDDDGNGLIEIRTAAELNMMRNNLAGTGLSGVVGETGTSLGCPAADGCNGYELVADIDLADGGYPNWIPIGTVSTPFTATLDGNDNTISNLNIYIEHIDNQGLFAAINNAVIRNVHLVGVSVISINNYNGYPGLGGTNIGALAGQAQGASMIIDSSASGSTIEGRTSVGGLIGLAPNAIIMRSSARFENITGLDGQHIGGLVGSGTGTLIGAQVTSSSTIIGRIVGDNNLGGLVGDATNARVRSSVARVNTIVRTPAGSGKINMGGLLGNAANAVISGSMSIASFVGDASQIAGGLIGAGSGVTVNASAAITGSIKVNLRHIGGLIGAGLNSKVANSYASTKVITSPAIANRGGLIGLPHTSGNASDGLAMVENSYWDNITLQVPDSRSFAADTIGVGSGALNTTNTFTGIFAEWGKVYINRTSGDLETFDTPPDTTPGSGTHTQAWNLDAFPEQYPLLNGLPITPAEQNTAIIRVLAGTSPAP